MEGSGASGDETSALGRFGLANGPAFVLVGCALLLGIVAGALSWRAGAEVERNTTFTIRIERLLSAMKDLETGQRGYLLTGDETYLEPYNQANGTLDHQLELVTESGLPVADLADLVTKRRATLASGIQQFRTGGTAAITALIQSGRGKALMDAVRVQVRQSEDESESRIAQARRTETIVAAPLALAAVTMLGIAFALVIRIAIRRRRAQLASAALLEGVLDNAPVGLGFLDPALRFQQMNKALRSMRQRALGSGVGESIWEVLPEMRAALEARLHTVVSGGRPVHNVDVEAASSDTAAPTRHYQVSFYPLQGTSPNGSGTQGAGMVVLDTTGRMRSERRMRESEERFRTLTESVSSMVWLTDGEGKFVEPQAGWAAFTGQTFEIYKGWGWISAIHPDDVAATEAAWTTAVAGRTPYKIEHRVQRSDGSWRYVAAHAAPIIDANDHVREWVGSHTDITERKEAELELAAAKDTAEGANRAKSVFLANMSHELRTPLSAVIGYSEMMEEEVEDLGVAALSTDLGKIKSNARHLLSLINDVLDLSKIEADRMDVYAEDLEVEPLLSDVSATVEALIRKKNNRLELQAQPGLGQMRTDAVKLRQCLFNLLSNAAKFTENGRIVLAASRATRPDGDWLLFRVSDSGIGMSPEQVDRLFQRFSQADETTTRKFGGTGLGLAITRAFCRLLGGDIRVESTPGVGTSFIMDLPSRIPDPKMDPEAPSAIALGMHPREREVVLVIDDDPAQRDLMSRFLERQGFAARAAPDGASGLEMARVLQPRAILLDVMMPHMDGWSVLTALKSDPGLATIPVVMVTFVHDTGMGAALGAADYLMKPVHWDKLKGVMDRFREAEGDVLIVDDDADARGRLRTILERNGWIVQEAANGREALEVVSRAVPRVILLDLTMPVMDGFSFLGELRQRPGCSDVPVIVLTARDLSAGDRQRLETADRVLSKGVTSLAEITRELRAVAPPISEPERAEEPLG